MLVSKKHFSCLLKLQADQQYSLTRGVDLNNVGYRFRPVEHFGAESEADILSSKVSTVLNADVPLTVRDYVRSLQKFFTSQM